MVLSQFSHQQQKTFKISSSNITKTVKSHTGIHPHFLYASCTFEKRKPCKQTPHQGFISAKQFFLLPSGLYTPSQHQNLQKQASKRPSINYPSGNQIILLQTATIKREYCLIAQISLHQLSLKTQLGKSFSILSSG